MVSLIVFKFTQLIRNEIKMAMFTINIETGNLLEAKEGRFDTFDSWGLELEFRRRGCFEHWDKKSSTVLIHKIKDFVLVGWLCSPFWATQNDPQM